MPSLLCIDNGTRLLCDNSSKPPGMQQSCSIQSQQQKRVEGFFGAKQLKHRATNLSTKQQTEALMCQIHCGSTSVNKKQHFQSDNRSGFFWRKACHPVALNFAELQLCGAATGALFTKQCSKFMFDVAQSWLTERLTESLNVKQQNCMQTASGQCGGKCDFFNHLTTHPKHAKCAKHTKSCCQTVQSSFCLPVAP